jgi:spore maturation protein CgeB
LPPPPAADLDASSVGSISIDRQKRIALLEAIAERYDLKLWGKPPAGSSDFFPEAELTGR